MIKRDIQLEFVQLDSLYPHEMTIPANIETRLSKLRKVGFYKPIIVDSESMVILDGHHKCNAAEVLGLSTVPVVMVDYQYSSGIEVRTWPGCGRDEISKDEIVEMGLSDELFPPKTSRHIFPFDIPTIRIPLDELR